MRRLRIGIPLFAATGLALSGLLPPQNAFLIPAPEAVDPVVSTDNPCWSFRRAERGFHRKINGARSVDSVTSLKLDPELSRVARKHTREMISRNLLHHTPSDALRRRVTNWNVLGENVGVGATVDSLHLAFMSSPSHRDNILYSTYRYVGVGTRKVNGRLWVTVIFSATANPGTTLRMPSC